MMEERIEQLIKDSGFIGLAIIAIGLDNDSFEDARAQQVIVYEDGRWNYRGILVVRTKTMTTISRF